MAILEVRKENNRQLQNIANTLAAAKKIVTVTGAGISTNCGIPDFRSEEGLYTLIQAQRDAVSPKKTLPATRKRPLASRAHTNPSPSQQAPKPPSIPNNIKGKDLFDANLWKDPTSTSVFYQFIASLRSKIRDDVKKTSSAHCFIKTLRDRRKLVRCYTQNIDGLELREELCTDMQRGKGNRSRFTKQSIEQPKATTHLLPGRDLDGGCEVVQLHGDLESLRCTLCQQTCTWDDTIHNARFSLGKAPACQFCLVTNDDRQGRGKRGTKVGTLRPNIVLYGEEHPSADAVGTITAHDLTLSPDVLLVLGTSLHVHGLKILVKEFSKCVHARPGGKGKVIFVNHSKPPESVWKDVFDYWVGMDCDDWVASMRRHRPDLFQVQNELKLPVTKPSANIIEKAISIPKFVSKANEDKENAPANQAPTPRKNKCRPLVIIESPRKKPPGQRLEPASLTQKKDEQMQIDTQLQLPTPPSSTGHDTKYSSPAKKRSLADTYRELCETPSRKRRRNVLTIWEDEEVGT